MITIKYEDVELKLPIEEVDANTEAFFKVIMPLIKKSLKNPAVQLNTLCIMHTGKNIKELFSDNTDLPEQMLQFIKQVVREMTKLDVITEPDLSGSTIEDILGRRE